MKNLFFIIPLMLLFACSDNALFDQNHPFASESWDRKEIVKFDVAITDTLHPYRIFINIRNNGNYSRRNLYMFVTVRSPKGDELKDTINCLLADEKGKWYGKSNLGDIYFNKFLYKPDVRFPFSGTYTFTLEQAMRSEKMENLEDVGIRIEPIE